MLLTEGGEGGVSVRLLGGGWRMVLECRDEGGPCGSVGGVEEGREECGEGRGEIGHDVWR